jgi:predicted permease
MRMTSAAEALEAISRDVLLAVRQLRRSPMFAATAVVSLALGIGANTAIFTLFDQVLVRPLPVRNPDQLVLLSWEGRTYGVNMGRDALSYPMYADLRDRNEVFSDLFFESTGAAVIRVLDNDWWGSSITPEGAETKGGAGSALMNIASPGYFRTLGTPFVAGKTFAATEAGRTSKVAIVNESFARRFFPGQNPIGRLFGMGNDPGTRADIEIVGLVGDAKYTTVRAAVGPQAFLDLDQHDDFQQVTLYVKTGVEPRQMYAAIRRALQEMDPNVPAFDMRTMEEQRDVTLVTDRLVASLALAFGLVATLLAAVGLYGLMAFTVAQRTREIGLRMALGAPSASVTWLVMKEVLALVSIGTAMAVPAAWVLAGLVRSQLYGITPNDPASMAGAALTLALVAAIAGCVPAIRAARIDPMRALRCE